MCTLTYLPVKEGFFLTSSRDEYRYRPTTPPMKYKNRHLELIYPRDEMAGGTWFAGSVQLNRVTCLINGAFQKHQKEEHHVRSRGTVLLECFDYTDILKFSAEVYLKHTEPFRLIMIDYLPVVKIYELIWDGSKKYIHQHPRKEPRIWSSASLYTDSAINTRKAWFENWYEQNRHQENVNIMGFHTSTFSDDAEIDLIMKRPDGPETVSITQWHHSYYQDSMRYIDLVQSKSYHLKFGQERKGQFQHQSV